MNASVKWKSKFQDPLNIIQVPFFKDFFGESLSLKIKNTCDSLEKKRDDEILKSLSDFKNSFEEQVKESLNKIKTDIIEIIRKNYDENTKSLKINNLEVMISEINSFILEEEKVIDVVKNFYYKLQMGNHNSNLVFIFDNSKQYMDLEILKIAIEEIKTMILEMLRKDLDNFQKLKNHLEANYEVYLKSIIDKNIIEFW